MSDIKNPDVAKVSKSYPGPVRKKLLTLRQLILDTASETDNVTNLEETLKWGEPSYIAKRGSTIRIDWKKSNQNYYAMYFHCTTKLVDTFKELHKDLFVYAGNRAIIFHKEDKLPIQKLKHCIRLSLTYHSIKHLPLLGA